MKKYNLNLFLFSKHVDCWIDGLPLRTIAEDTGTSAATLSRIIRGEKPNVDTFVNLCKHMQADRKIYFISEETEYD